MARFLHFFLFVQFFAQNFFLVFRKCPLDFSFSLQVLQSLSIIQRQNDFDLHLILKHMYSCKISITYYWQKRKYLKKHNLNLYFKVFVLVCVITWYVKWSYIQILRNQYFFLEKSSAQYLQQLFLFVYFSCCGDPPVGVILGLSPRTGGLTGGEPWSEMGGLLRA